MDTGYARAYGDLEETHWWFRARRKILRQSLAALPWPAAPRILEIGIGSGLNLYTLYPPGAQLAGVEPEAANAARARTRGTVPVYVATVENLPAEIADGSLDGIAMFDVLEHTKDDLVALASVRKKLKPGGLLVLTVPTYMWLWGQQDDISYHYRRYTIHRLEAQLATAGFHVTRATYFDTFLFPPVALFRVLARWLRPRGKPAGTDFKYTLGLADHLLYAIFAAEAPCLRHVNFPFGVSALVIAHA